jgi:hypothetical protein
MSEEVVLWYETDAKSGTPALKVHSGKAPVDEAELAELEREVRSRYDKLARGSGGRATFRSQSFEVEVVQVPNPRQPKLVLRWTRPMPNGAARGTACDWAAGFFQELRQRLEGAGDEPLSLHEKGSLTMALDELRSLTEAGGVDLAAVLLAGYLATAEQHCRSTDTARSGVYVLALRGLGRLLPDPGGAAVARERLLSGAQGTTEEHRPAPWLRRFFGWLAGSTDSVANSPR